MGSKAISSLIGQDEARRARQREYSRNYYHAHKDRCRESNRKWKAKNPERVKAKQRRWYDRHYVAWTYGVTTEWYETRLAAQKGVCAICGGTQLTPKRKLAIDHNHETGKVRGLLCDRCNIAMERLDGVPNWELKAREYLNEF